MREPGTIPYGHASPISHGHGEHAKSTYIIKHQRHAQRVAKVGWYFTYLSHLLYHYRRLINSWPTSLEGAVRDRIFSPLVLSCCDVSQLFQFPIASTDKVCFIDYSEDKSVDAHPRLASVYLSRRNFRLYSAPRSI